MSSDQATETQIDPAEANELVGTETDQAPTPSTAAERQEPSAAAQPAEPVEEEDQEDGPAQGGYGANIAPIPRISIHAFCLSPQTGGVIKKAAVDRRFAKAHVSVEMGGLEAAIAHFKDTPTPNLILVESNANADGLFALLGQLADVCDPGTKVVVMGNCNDISVYRELMRHGISEYLLTPLTPIQVLETIASLYSDPTAPPLGRTITFVGAKGGTGASTLAHNVAWAITEQFDETAILADLDLPFGTAGLNFNQDPSQGIADALLAPERVDDVMLERLLLKCTDRLSLLSAPAALDRELEASPETFETVLEVMRKSVPNVVIDLPHIWTPWSKRVLLSSDQIVVVAMPDLASLRNAMNMFEIFKLSRPNDAPPHLVLNKLGRAKKVEINEKDFAEAMHIEPALTIPYDADLFGNAANNGQMIGEIDSKGEIAGLIRNLTTIVTGREVPVKKRSNIFNLLSKSIRQKRSA